MMKQLSSVLFILLLFNACSQEIPEEYTNDIEAIFSNISVSEELNLYIDNDGQPADGHYTSNYQNGALQADVTFKDGMISEGEIFSSYGRLGARYSTERGMMKTTYYNATASHPTMVTLKNDLSKDIEANIWAEDGTQLVEQDQTVMKNWYLNGQPMFDVSLKDGEYHGKSLVWFENGQIKSEMYFTNGVENGTFQEWDEKGNLVSKKVYDMGKLVSEN